MKTKAAIAVKAGEDLVIEELDLDGPGDNEVLVEIRQLVCVTQMHLHYLAMIQRDLSFSAWS